MIRESTEIFISGGGIAGLCAAAAFGSAGFEVICVEPNPPVLAEEKAGSDLRTTALLQPSIAVFEAAGLWSRLAPHATALRVMRIVDAGGPESEPRMVCDFDAAEISDQPFGWNLPNWLLRREILARIEELPNVSFRPSVATKSLLTRDAHAVITLSDDSTITARLLIAADGRESPTRQSLGIGVNTLRYGQKALAFAVQHPIPHNNISTEIHKSGGPFTLVPLPDRDDRPSSAVVWMERGPEALRLAGLPERDFAAAISERSGHVLGPLTPVSRRTIWPIISQLADRIHGPRTALMAEAAHVVPPIGAQGLNMSLADLACLLELATAAEHDIGSPRMLGRYQHKRYREIATRIAGIDALNRASMLGAPVLRDGRARFLSTIYAIAPIRRQMMRAGLGLRA